MGRVEQQQGCHYCSEDNGVDFRGAGGGGSRSSASTWESGDPAEELPGAEIKNAHRPNKSIINKQIIFKKNILKS